MGRLDLPDPIRDEDIWVSAHTLCAVRDCAMPGCEEDARPGKRLCDDCGAGRGQLGLRLLMASTPEPPARPVSSTTRPPLEQLTEKETRALRCAANGLTGKETAMRFGKATNTIKVQRHRAIQKLGALNIAHAVAIAFRAGLLD